jgi:hypothetical protein
MGLSKCSSSQGNPPETCASVEVSTGEVCTIDTAKEYGIFDETNYFNIDDKINTLSENTVDSTKVYSLCNPGTNNTANKNCVLSSGNPWKTIDDSGEYCMLPRNIELPSVLKYIDSSSIEKTSNIKIWDNKTEYCQEKWYDWFSIPDYHFGNKYTYVSNVKKCMQPCSLGNVPDLTLTDKCISKADFKGGLVNGTFPYLPISLIMLLGSDKTSLLAHYDSLLKNISGSANDIFFDPKVYSALLGDASTRDNIYNDIKKDLKIHINNLIALPYDDRHINIPSFDDSKMIVNTNTAQHINEAYDIAQKLFTMCGTDQTSQKCTDFKKSIADISGYDINSSQFHKQMLTLKKACNIAFDGTRHYSTNIILHNLPKTDKTPIKFEITEKDRLKSVSKNPSENAENTINSPIVLQSEELRSQEAQTQKLENNDTLQLNKLEYDPRKYDENNYVNETPPGAKTFYNLKNIIMTTMFIILFIIFIGVLYLIISMMWGPFADMINTIILATYYGMFKLKDLMFRGKYDPPSLNKDIVELQMNYLDRKINTDLKRFKLDADKLGIKS